MRSKERRPLSFAPILIASSILFVSLGCVGLSSSPQEATVSIRPMTQARMEFLFAEQVDAIIGPPGSIQTRIDGINIYLISNPENDRMRIVAPFAMLEQVDPRVYEVLLTANFHSTLDARYAASEGVLYAAFLHPLSSLSPALLDSAVAQVVSLVKTFGSTFSSGDLQFREPGSPDR